ncbi:MAG: pilus assembly protein PilM [Clostridia bacterium]|nr:pilus assembly protein PilM [Clostridia bacterium]
MTKVNSAIGIEYNSHEIKAVELLKKPDGTLEATAFGKEIIPEGVMNEGMIADTETFISVLNQLFSSGNFTENAPVVVGVNNENVILRYATFPKVPDDKLRNVITMQAGDFIPVPVSELGLDFVVINEAVDDDDQPIINVLLIGARTQMLENLIGCFNESKFDVMDIDSSFLAWIRATMEEAVPDEIYGFLNLTDDVLNFVVIVENDIKMVRSIGIPDRAALDVRKVFENAEALTEEEVMSVTDFMYQELSSSISYFQMQYGYQINKIIFSAASSAQSSLLEAISQKSYVPVTLPNLYNNYMTNDFNPEGFTGCISLAKVALEG